MVRLWKLTDENDQTYRGLQWGEGVTHTALGTGDLCTSGWIHAYTDPLLAVFLNPIHADFVNPHLWEAEGVVGKTDHGLKVGCTTLTTLRRVDLPHVTTEQRVRFGILCTCAVYHIAPLPEETWRTWATRWLDGTDRSRSAAWSAVEAAWAEAEAGAVAEAAWVAARAAWAAESLWAVAQTAWVAARAVEAAAALGELDLPAIAREAVASWSTTEIAFRSSQSAEEKP